MDAYVNRAAHPAKKKFRVCIVNKKSNRHYVRRVGVKIRRESSDGSDSIDFRADEAVREMDMPQSRQDVPQDCLVCMDRIANIKQRIRTNVNIRIALDKAADIVPHPHPSVITIA